MKRGIEKVAVVKCNDYEQKKVDKAVEKALKLINFDFSKFRRKKVLIKPNVVSAHPKKQIAITTNPALVEAVCKILKKNKCRIFVGDSPFMEPENSFKTAKLDKVAEKYGKLIIFEQDKLIGIKDDKAKVLKKFKIAKTVRDADLVINMPKLKTHVLTKYTGAVKNLYGLIPGGMKQRTHLRAKGDKKFSNVLVDIYQNVKPELTIMDGIIGMEGEGPTSGQAIKSGLILASKNGIALDIAAVQIMGLKPRQIYTIRFAVKRKIYPNFKFELVGMKKLPLIKFKKPPKSKRRNIQSLLNKRFREKPILVNEKKCVKCGTCARKCPAHAITLKPYPVFDREKCIRCFCCIEICPQDALSLGK